MNYSIALSLPRNHMDIFRHRSREPVNRPFRRRAVIAWKKKLSQRDQCLHMKRLVDLDLLKPDFTDLIYW